MSSCELGTCVHVPEFPGFDYGIENGEQFAHGREEGNLFGFAFCAQGHGHLGLQAAGGFQHNLRGRHQVGTQFGQACGIIRHPSYGILTSDSHIQVLLRHIDSHKNRAWT